MLRCRIIPFGLTVFGAEVRVVDLGTGEVLPTPKESEQRRLQAEREAREALARLWAAEAQADQARAQAPDMRTSDLEAELARLRRLLAERDGG